MRFALDFRSGLRTLVLGVLAASTAACVVPGENVPPPNHDDGGGVMVVNSHDAGMQQPVDSGPVTGTDPLGAACTESAVCGAGSSPECLTPAQNFPGGYCSSDCMQDSDCGTGGVCATYLVPVDGGVQGGCLLGCTANSDCRQGYICADDYGPMGCLPDDCRFVPEICPAGTACDEGDGKCQNAPAANSGYPAAHDAPPNVVNLGGGPVLTSPVIVAIFFSNDDATFVSEASDFYNGIGASDFWKVAMEYGVGPATGNVVTLTETAPRTIDDTPNCTNSGCSDSPLQTWLAGDIANGDLPMPTANTVYVINYPSTTTVTQDGSTGCVAGGWAGYHEDFIDGANDIAVAVIPRCSGGPGFPDIDVLTSTASHELMESSTDPLPFNNPAFDQVDNAQLYWDEANYGSEIGDMCQDDYQAYLRMADFPYLIQRMWSNNSVNAGHDPCVPEYPAELYFNGVPELSTSITFDYYYNNGETATGVSIPVGGTATVPIQLYTDFPTDEPFDVQVLDYYGWYGGVPLLNITQDKYSGQNGDTVNATINVVTAGNENDNTDMEVTNTELFVVLTCSPSCSDYASYVHAWYGVVGN